jgi:hypothetical protein
MKKHILRTTILYISLILSACGTSDKSEDNPNTTNRSANASININDSGWETIETISDRNIIAKLKQTVKDTPKRDQMVAEFKERADFKDGLFGEPADQLAEDLVIQQVEGDIAIPLAEKIYGGYDAFNQEGVVFMETKTSGAAQSGIWIGIKKADERLEKLIDELQAKVDAGEIKAEYIYIFHTPHTIAENTQLMNEVSKEVSNIQQHHETPNRVSFSVNVDTITGEIEIGHNFLKEEQKESLRVKFPARKVVFEQEGRLAPVGEEPDTFYPEKEFTNEPTKEGAYVMDLSKDGMLVVNAQSNDYSKTGGESEFFSAIQYSFPDALKKLKIGQRVKVEPSGPILESYPGQGAALYVEVLPEYKPGTADLSESQVVRAAIEKAKDNANNWVLAIRELSYNEKSDQWVINFKQENEEFEVIIKDEPMK